MMMTIESVDLSVCIISHGHGRFLQTCLDSLSKGSSDLNTEIVFLDNLNEGVADSLLFSPFMVTVINNETTQGFAWNVNECVRHARGRYVLILNPDTVFLSGSLKGAIAFMDGTDDAGVVACQLLNPDGGIQQSYRRFPSLPVLLLRGLAADRWPWRPAFYRSRLMEDVSIDKPTVVDWVFGAFLLMNKEVFVDMGMMDDRFRLYYEDVDLCRRLKNRGLNTYLYPDVKVQHEHIRASAKKPFSQLWRWHFTSAIRYFLKQSL